MKKHLRLLTLSLFSWILFVVYAVAQQPPASSTQPTPPAAATPPPASTPPPPTSVPPPPAAAPPVPHTPVLPSAASSAEMTSIHEYLKQEKADIEAERAYIDQAQKHINEINGEIGAFEKLTQEKVAEVKKKEGWGADVELNRQTEKFERPLPGAAGKSASQPAQRQPINKDTNSQKEKP